MDISLPTTVWELFALQTLVILGWTGGMLMYFKTFLFRIVSAQDKIASTLENHLSHIETNLALQVTALKRLESRMAKVKKRKGK